MCAQVFEKVSRHPSTNGILANGYQVLAALLATDSQVIDGRDFDKCLAMFQSLSGESGEDMTTEEPLTWGRILGPGNCSSSVENSMCTAVIYECMRCMYDTELVIRTGALSALKSLIDCTCMWISNASQSDDMKSETNLSWLDNIKSVVMSGVYHGLKHAKDTEMKGFILLLSHVANTLGVHPLCGHEVIFHRDLNILRHSDPEQNFFENIIHVQLHRRVKAMNKLKSLLLSTVNDSTQNDVCVFTSNSLINVIMPLAFHPIVSDEYQKKDHQLMSQEAASLLGAIASKLNWSDYFSILKTILRRLGKESLSKEKILLIALCAILDAFHFDLTSVDVIGDSIDDIGDAMETLDAPITKTGSIDETENVVGEGMQASGDPITKAASDDDEDEDENHVEERDKKTMKSQSARISRVVLEVIVPWVKRFLLKVEKDHAGHKNSVVRTPVAVALTKLLGKMKPPVVPEKVRQDMFVNLVISVIGTMKSRDAAVRDTSRDSLSKMVQTLGIQDSLYAVLYELRNSLTEGYQKHVCNYTIRTLLTDVLEDYSPPKDAATIDISTLDEISYDNLKIIIPYFDRCIPLIMASVMEDLMGICQEDREVDGAVRTLIREAKGSKANDILEICAKSILFRPTYALTCPDKPASVSSVHAMTSPLLTAMTSCEDMRVVGRIGEALQRIATGLSKNPSLLPAELFLYLHSTLQPFVASVAQDYVAQREAKKRLLHAGTSSSRKSNRNRSTDGSDDDEDELDANLPSYLRDESTDEDELPLYSKKKKTSHSNSSQTTTWLPSDKGAHLGQREAIAARDKEQRELTRVQDGASAPTLTGRNRYKDVTTEAKEGTNQPATIAALKFCLSLLSSTLKRGRLDGNNELVRKMAAPIMPMLGQCLRLSGASSVVALAMRSLCTLLSWGLSVTPGFSRAVGRHMVLLMCRGGALVTTDNDLVQACLKGLSALFQLHIANINIESEKRSTSIDEPSKEPDMPTNNSELDDEKNKLSNIKSRYPLKDDSIRALLTLLTSSVTEVMSSNQNSAFQLIKTMIEARIVFPEMYDLIDKLSDQIVLPQKKVRFQSTFCWMFLLLNGILILLLLLLLQSCYYF